MKTFEIDTIILPFMFAQVPFRFFDIFFPLLILNGSWVLLVIHSNNWNLIRIILILIRGKKYLASVAWGETNNLLCVRYEKFWGLNALSLYQIFIKRLFYETFPNIERERDMWIKSFNVYKPLSQWLLRSQNETF